MRARQVDDDDDDDDDDDNLILSGMPGRLSASTSVIPAFLPFSQCLPEVNQSIYDLINQSNCNACQKTINQYLNLQFDHYNHSTSQKLNSMVT